MTPDRFQQIVQAYGADPQRWPQQERAAGEAWAGMHREQADVWLAEAADLDAALTANQVAPPSAALQQRIIASAPVRRTAFLQRMWWKAGAAVAGIGLLGGVAGALAVSFFVLTEAVPPVQESSYLTSSFGGSSADWRGE